jgi:hypothetical protein
MEQIFKIAKYVFITIMLISCGTREEKKFVEVNNKILSHSFPDTVKINTVIEGSLKYDVNSIGFESDSIASRFLELLLTTSINQELANYNQVDNNRLLSYVDSLPTGKFKFHAVFEKKGKQMINVVIRDYMYLKPDKNTPHDKMTLRISDCLFSKEVYVVD